MRVILDLEKKVLDDLQSLAFAEKRSRKNFMELALINTSSGNNPIMQIQDLTKPTNQIIPVTDVKPIVNTVINTVPLPKASLFDDFMSELKEARTKAEVEKIMKAAKGEVFTLRQKQMLEAYAKEVSKDMYND